jgi:DNA repair protein RecO (recombination protein O)
MGIEKTEAIVINSRDWKETSKIVTFFTSSHGKLTAIAKGARRKNNPFRNYLQLFAYLNLVYYEKEGRELQVVSQCSELESFQGLREDLVKTAYASYFVQLVDEMVRGKEGSEELFRLLLAALYWLKEEGSSEMLARFFELHLLRVLGYNPMLRSCAVCQGPVRLRSHLSNFSIPLPPLIKGDKGGLSSPLLKGAGRVKLSPSSGGIVCESCLEGTGDCRTLSGGVYSALLHLQSVDIVKLKRLRLSHILSEELKSAMYYYLEYFLEKRLKSQDFLEQILKS